MRVCLQHKPTWALFCPFLGQQTKFWKTRARRVLVGGGAGGAKTYVGWNLWLKQWHWEQARMERGEIQRSVAWTLFLRRTNPEILQVISEFKRDLPLYDPGARWNERDKLAEMSNGMHVQFGGMENEGDWQKYYGNEYSLVVIDEAWTATVKQIKEVDSRLRSRDPWLDARLQLYLMTNPLGGETKAWLKQEFVSVAPPETELEEEVTLEDGRKIVETRVYIPCNLFDNPALTASGRYEANLSQKGDATRRALLLNDWDVDEGTWVGSDWDRAIHVCEPFVIPAHWKRAKSADYGYGSLAVVHWYASDEEGNTVCYRAWTCRRLTAREFGMRIRAIESVPLVWKDREIVPAEWDPGEDVSTVFGPMDQSVWATTGEAGESRGEVLDALGCGFFRSDRGPKVRHTAAEHIRYMLRRRSPDYEGKVSPGIPGLRYFRGTTETRMKNDEGTLYWTGPLHTIPALPFDPDDPDVPDTDANDHDWDALAYFVSSRPEVADRPEPGIVLDFVSFRQDPNTVRRKINW